MHPRLMRRLLIASAILLLLAAAADGVWWRWAEQQLDSNFTARVAALRAAGWKVTHQPAEPGGWPFAARLNVADVSLSGEGVSWSGERLTLQVTLVHPLRLAIETAGRQSLHLGTWPALTYSAEALVATVPLRPGAPPQAVNVYAARLNAASAEAGLALASLTVQADWSDPSRFLLSVEAGGVLLPPGNPWPFGAAINRLAADLAVSGKPPRPNTLAAWRDAGGALEIRRLELAWGALSLGGHATLGLDAAMQPTGSGEIRLTDPEAALTALRENGMINDRTELAARALLSLMARPGTADARPEVELPVALQDRRMTVSSFAIARLPPIAWP